MIIIMISIYQIDEIEIFKISLKIQCNNKKNIKNKNIKIKEITSLII